MAIFPSGRCLQVEFDVATLNISATYWLTILTTYRVSGRLPYPRSRRGVSGDDPAGGARCGVPARGRNRGPGGSGPQPRRARHPGSEVAGATEPEATPETESAERAQNRQGGAPRGPFRFASGRLRLANVGSRLTSAIEMRIPPPGAPPAPRGGDRSSKGQGKHIRRSVKQRRDEGGEQTRTRKRGVGTKKTARRRQGYGGLAYLPAEASAKAGALFDIVKRE
jgi:hypothetical protein